MSDARSILLSSASNEWYTPSIYIAAVRAVLGTIDLDPASCEQANDTIQADRFYTQAENGLMYPWYGRVWLNPPYGTTTNKSNAGLWTRKLIAEYQIGRVKQAIVLVNASPSTHWFHQLLAFPVCLTEGRINFRSPIHKTDTAFSRPEKSQNTNGSAFAYLGSNTQTFIETFEQFGTIVQRISRAKQSVWLPELWHAEVVA
jgi:phage N-6-adenine-methyltransferase